MFKKYSEYNPQKKTSFAVKESSNSIKPAKKLITQRPDKMDEGLLFDIAKAVIFGKNKKTEIVSKEDSELFKYIFAKIYVDGLHALTFPIGLERLYLKPDFVIKSLQKTLKENIEKFKNKQNLHDEYGSNVLNTGYFKNGKPLVHSLDGIVKNIQNYIKNNVERVVSKEYPTKLNKYSVSNEVLVMAYKKLFNNTFNVVGSKGKNQYEIIADYVVKQVKKQNGVDFLSMVVNDTEKNKYLKSKVPTKINREGESKIEKEIASTLKTPEVKKQEDQIINKIEKEIEKKEKDVKIEQEVKKEKIVKPPLEKKEDDKSILSKKKEIEESFINEVIDKYISKRKYIKTKRLENSLKSEINSAYKELQTQGIEPSVEGVLNVIMTETEI